MALKYTLTLGLLPQNYSIFEKNEGISKWNRRQRIAILTSRRRRRADADLYSKKKEKNRRQNIVRELVAFVISRSTVGASATSYNSFFFDLLYHIYYLKLVVIIFKVDCMLTCCDEKSDCHPFFEDFHTKINSLTINYN
jgi:hypothetical protein